jgi:KaiC/GvpD/RAD55 family RecA-like ATPase
MLDETTGFPEFDRLVESAGARAGEIIVICGRHTGKSYFIEQLRRLAESDIVAVKVTLDDSGAFALAELDNMQAELERRFVVDSQRQLRLMAEAADHMTLYESVPPALPRANEPYYQRFSRHYRRK